MEASKRPIKIALIGALITIITVLHYRAVHGHLEVHILHRELYFIPILLAAFWFGLKPGLITSIGISLLYAPHIFMVTDRHSALVTAGIQVLVFNIVAALMGWLIDRRQRQDEEARRMENMAVLGRAAAAVGYEMKELLNDLKGLSRHTEALNCTEFDRDFKREMDRMEDMVETLTSFVPRENVTLLSHDLNSIILDRIDQNRDAAQKIGATFQVAIDEKGCPSRVDPEKISWVIDSVIKNALDVSQAGQSVTIRSRRGSANCHVDIQDNGPGIRPEHLSRIFTPFFTTRKDGQGLALAGCKKIMNDLGGDILVTSEWGKGALFTLTIPREAPEGL